MNCQFHDLKDKHVFITGGGSGIGAALTEGFLAQGAKVSFVQRSDASDFVAKMKEKHGVAPSFFACDLSDVDAIKSSMTAAQKRHGDIDVLVNNAGNDVRHEIKDLTPDQWDFNHAVNLRPYFFTAQFVAPFMAQNGGGAIINYSSISYMMGNDCYAAYVTANAGITGLTRALARELGPQNIRVNAIAPGWVLTQKQLDQWASPEGLQDHLARQCLKTHLAPEDMVGGTLFLASSASKMMTGQVMVIDGGVVVTG
ncbi:SDR family NAD(P)-dependent oxidoreductase [Pacificibacter marinus]|uniref:SDR family NAD(P)-dependent oxidoreductase n=1 Tax=Pacificibacter marinus TaxID=658057 RepID=UPI001C07905B|nr:SDR family oxidoreductase [Pacificibacter marinus]MBU2867232.1 SDR family oxidoreductase [Pacificibacter marinus]